MTDIEWWIRDGQYRFSIGIDEDQDGTTTVALLERRSPGHRWVGTFESVQQAVDAARGSR